MMIALVLVLLAASASAWAQTSQLQVTISSPRDQARVDHESIALAGLVSGERGIALVIVTLNGVEVTRLQEATPRPAFALSLPLVLREGTNILVVKGTDVAGTMREEVRTIHYERPVPLTLEVRSPQDEAPLAEASTVVAAVATSSKKVARIQVTVNGVEVHERVEDPPTPSALLTVPVKLREGPNVVVVTASEPDGTEVQEVRTIFFHRPSVAGTPAPPAPPPRLRTERWAVVIGVGTYENRAIPALRFTVSDAELIARVLVEFVGFKKENVLLLTDKTERKPTLRSIKWALGTFLPRSAKKDDTVLVFFAGHGAPEVDPRGQERDGLSKYLVPSDADPQDLYATAFPMDEIENVFARIEAGRVVAFLDTCYSGAAGGRTFTPSRTRVLNVDAGFLERLARIKGRAIITASRPSEVSLELSELGHGIFSYYLADGFRGTADLNRDGIVTLQELYEYLEKQVAQKSRSVGGNQHPMMKGELEGTLPLVKVGPR